MQAQKRRCAAVENVERGAGAWVDLEQKGHFVSHQEVGGGETLDSERARDTADGRNHLPL
jgi:hypothetical protein